MALNVIGGPLEFAATLDTTEMAAAIRRIEADLKGVTSSVKKQGDEIEGYAKKASLAIGSFLSFQAASSFVSDLVRVRGEFQKLEAVLTNSLGSSDMAKSSLGMIADYAAKTPFQLDEVAGAYVKLVNQGFKPTREELTKIGDLAASTGKGFDQLAEAILDAQSGEMERLKEFGIRAEKAGDQVTFTFKGQKTVVDASAESIRNYITSLGALQGVSGSTAAISATLVGQISNLQDAWGQMLNEVGKSSEGILSSGIAAAASVVENYQTVIDILKVLVITYGSYRAAVIATTAVQAIQTQATMGYTIAEQLRYRAMLISEAAMKLLNRTMLANPAVAITAGIAALAATLYFFAGRAKEASTAQKLLSDATEDMNRSLAEVEAKIRPYVEALKNANISEAERVRIYNELKAIDPQIVAGLDAKTLSYQALEKSVKLYLGSLRQQYALEANKKALQASVQMELDYQKRKETAEKQIELDKRLIAQQKDYDNRTAREARARILRNEAIAKEANAALERQRDVSSELAQTELNNKKQSEDGKQAAILRTVEVIDKEIDAAKKAQKEQSANRGKWLEFEAKIKDLEAERRRITGQAIKEQHAGENKLNQLLEQRKGLLQDIADMQRGAKQSGLVKEASELDKINERYDTLFRKISEYNEKARKEKAPQIGLPEINALNAARQQELANQNLKDDAARYAKSLEAQKAIFERHSEAVKAIGIAKANEMFDGQTQGFDDYLQYLENEAAKLAPKLVFGIANIGDITKFKAVTDQMKAETEKQAKAESDRVVQLFTLSATYNDKMKLLETARLKDIATLQKRYTGEDLRQRIAAIDKFYDQQRARLEEELIALSPLYQKLSESLLTFNRDALKRKAKELAKILKDGFTTVDKGDGVIEVIKLTPQMIADLENGINNVNGLVKSTGTFFGVSGTKLAEMAGEANKVSGIFADLSRSFEPINRGLSQALDQLSQMAGVAGNALSGAAAFASGDYVAAAASAAQMVGSIVTVFAEAKQSADSARKSVSDFYQAIRFGEIQTAMAMRERMALEASLHKTTLERLKAEKAQLDQNRAASQAQYNDLLKQLQQEQYVISQGTKKGKGSALFGLVGYLTGIGGKTEVTQELRSLANMTYEQIEKLFNTGQLTEKAKDLFQQLQRLKQEGVDIDKQLQDLKAEAAQLYTATTADSISKMIRDGFGDGLRTVQDFSGKTEDLIREALLNGLEYGIIQKQVQKLYEQFAEDAEDGGGLDLEEIGNFTRNINKTIEDAAKFTKEIEKATGISLTRAQSSNAANANNLTGAIKGMTEQQADLLAGQFGGLRLSNLEILQVGRQALAVHNQIEVNTAATAARLETLVRKFDSYEVGAKGIKVNM